MADDELQGAVPDRDALMRGEGISLPDLILEDNVIDSCRAMGIPEPVIDAICLSYRVMPLFARTYIAAGRTLDDYVRWEVSLLRRHGVIVEDDLKPEVPRCPTTP